MAVKLDEIGYWSEVKLDIVSRYAKEYSKIMTSQEFIKGHYYIDAFAGAGVHIAKGTREPIPGSPLNALMVEPPFTGYTVIDPDGQKVQSVPSKIDDGSWFSVCSSADAHEEHQRSRCVLSLLRRSEPDG